MNSKLFGGILLVVGTTIGAGMLALPIATANAGFFGSLSLLVSCWAIMLISALLFLEVNLWLPTNSNMISMAGATLGRMGQALTWVVYLLLLYSILAAYIAGGGDLFHYLLSVRNGEMSHWSGSIIFTLILGLVVYLGVRAVDYVNRGLMFGKLGAYFILVMLLLPFIATKQLAHFHLQPIISATSISVTAVSFGSLMIIPSLRSYFGEDIKSLRIAIIAGSVIPLVCYIAWDMVIMGVIPLKGAQGLGQMVQSSTSNSDLLTTLSSIVQSETILMFAKFFTSVCMATSFLGISLCLSDFIADGLGMKKQGVQNIIIYAATFVPPLLAVLFYQDAFIRGLRYAGINCIILMILLPALMVWRGRYYCELTADNQVWGGKILLALLIIFATLILSQGLLRSAIG